MINFLFGFIFSYIFIDVLLIIADFSDAIIIFDNTITYLIFLPFLPAFIIIKAMKNLYYYLRKRWLK